MAKKIYVDVILHHSKEGHIKPLAIVWANGVKYAIDRVTQITKAASTVAGGTGIRYTCYIQGQPRYLYLEEDRWFIESHKGV